jgi:Putative transposase
MCPPSAAAQEFPDLIGGRSRSKTPRRRDRLPLHPAQLGFEPPAPPACPLCRPHRRILPRPPGLDPYPSALPAAHPGAPPRLRNKFVFGLKRLYSNGSLDCSGPAAAFQDRELFSELLNQLRKKKWVVYAKPPFGGPAHVLRYLGRYTHRIAISNHRLLTFDGERVSFRWKDYAHGGKQRIMTLDATEFLRRFFLHVLPKGFVRIRHFGLLFNRFRSRSLSLARKLLARDGRDPLPPPETPAANPPLWHCPRCGGPMGVARELTVAELSLLRHIDSS